MKINESESACLTVSVLVVLVVPIKGRLSATVFVQRNKK